MKNVYLDNSATSFPKAPGVSSAINNYIDNIGVNIGRGTYKTSCSAGQIVYETRSKLCELFNFDNPLNVVFTANITQSINTILKGFLKPNDHVIISSMEHNSVVRPLNSLAKSGVEYDIVTCNADGTLNETLFETYIKSNTKIVIMTHASNVCGTILPIKEIGEICKRYNIHFILDSAQSAGSIDIDFKNFNLSALTFTGHKGLLGPQGIGGFIIRDDFSQQLQPFIEGGTGSISESEFQPAFLPDKFESGTLNIPGIFGLNASIEFIQKTGIKTIKDKEMYLTNRFIDALQNISEINIIGLKGIEGRTSVISLNFKNLDNSEVAFILERDFGIMTRVGLHCAPLAHKTLNTYPEGTLRFSIGYFNTLDEIIYTVDSIHKTINLLK